MQMCSGICRHQNGTRNGCGLAEGRTRVKVRERVPSPGGSDSFGKKLYKCLIFGMDAYGASGVANFLECLPQHGIIQNCLGRRMCWIRKKDFECNRPLLCQCAQFEKVSWVGGSIESKVNERFCFAVFLLGLK